VAYYRTLTVILHQRKLRTRRGIALPISWRVWFSCAPARSQLSSQRLASQPASNNDASIRSCVLWEEAVWLAQKKFPRTSRPRPESPPASWQQNHEGTSRSRYHALSKLPFISAGSNTAPGGGGGRRGRGGAAEACLIGYTYICTYIVHILIGSQKSSQLLSVHRNLHLFT
jgi:hypothetical protein